MVSNSVNLLGEVLSKARNLKDWLNLDLCKLRCNLSADYSGPEGARVKVPPLFFVIIIICSFWVLNFLLGYKA